MKGGVVVVAVCWCVALTHLVDELALRGGGGAHERGGGGDDGLGRLQDHLVEVQALVRLLRHAHKNIYTCFVL